MAFVGPALAAVGGGSAIAGGITVATAALGAYSAYESIQAGRASRADAKRAAVREQDAARGEEIQRRRELQRVLAMRNADAAAGGVTTGGSIGVLARRDIRDNRNDLLTDSVNSKAKQRALRSAGSQAYREGVTQGAASLLDSASLLYENMPRPAASPART